MGFPAMPNVLGIPGLPPSLTEVLDPILSQMQITLPNGELCPLPLIFGAAYHGAPAQDFKQAVLPGQPCEHYNCLQLEGRPCRFPTEALPVRIYTPYEKYRPVTQAAIEMWNQTGQQAHHVSFFQLVNSADDAQITVDWGGATLEPKVAGRTRLRCRRTSVEVVGIDLNDTGNYTAPQLTEIVAHELGHSLGLDHSDELDDIMYRSTRETPRTQLSQRDKWMVGWLYGQQGSCPMLAFNNKYARERP
jgi:hypothetical protein